MKDEWRFAQYMNALKQQSSLNQWYISKLKRSRSKWNAKIDKERRVQIDENKNRCVSFNFILSCYYHHCCYSNEQSFKFETSFFISIKSLLVLFASAFISCCQIIVVKLISSFYQIDLSLKNSSLIYTSSVSLSLIMSSIIRYMMFMLASRFSKTFHFDEHNITKFLKYFEKQCNEYEVIEKKR